MKLILVCGPVGVGKTTYSISLAKKNGAVRFSIDPWMQTLFSQDLTSFDYAWITERVKRCHEQIWEVSKQILALDGQVILDLGATTKAERSHFVDRANEIGIATEIHYLTASKEVRQQRVKTRNAEKDPAVYAFEVNDFMFDFMEPKFEAPDDKELLSGCIVDCEESFARRDRQKANHENP